MGETNYHLKDDFFEEILNGIPESEEKRQEYLKNIEKNSKTSLSPDNKTRLKRVAASFLSTEESKKAFIELIKNAKKRDQDKFLKEIKKSILIDKIEDEEGFEEEISEEMNEDDSKSDGLFSKVRKLKSKYQNLKEKRNRAQKIYRMINNIKGYYLFLSALTTNQVLKSKDGIIRKMNKITNDFLEGNIGGIVHTTIIPSAQASVITAMNNLKRIIDGTIKKFNLALYEGVSTMMKVFITIVMIAASAGAGAKAAAGNKIAKILAGAGSAGTASLITDMVLTSMEGGELDLGKIKDLLVKLGNNFALSIGNFATKLPEYWEMIKKGYNNLEDVYETVGKGFSYIMYKFRDNSDIINEKLQKVCSNISKTGDIIIEDITNKDGPSLSDNFQMGSRIVHDVFEEGTLLFKQEFRGMENSIIYNVDQMSTTQNKYDFVYEVMSKSYFKEVNLSPWSLAARELKRFVRYLYNSFIDISEPLDMIVNNQSAFYNSKGKIVDLTKYLIDKIGQFEEGVRVHTKSGKVFNLRLKKSKRHSTIPKSKNSEENSKYYEMKLFTKQSIIKRYEENKTKTGSKLVLFENFYKPVVKIKNPKNKILNYTSSFLNVRTGKKEVIVNSGAHSYDFEQIGINTEFYKSINAENKSLRSIALTKFFNGEILKGYSTIYDPNFMGIYQDENYMTYARNISALVAGDGYTDSNIISRNSIFLLTLKMLKNGDYEGEVANYHINSKNSGDYSLFEWGYGEEGSLTSKIVSGHGYKFSENEPTPYQTMVNSELLMENYILHRFNMINFNTNLTNTLIDAKNEEISNLIKQ